MRKEFPYFKKDVSSFPIIDVELVGFRRSLIIKALVDSGATFSVFQAEIGDFLEIPIENGKPIELQGLKGKILGYLHELPIRLRDEKFNCKIVFSKELGVSFNLLGRNNFFLPFLITFNEKHQKILIEKNQ
jgi:hypothetical protein